MHERVELTVQSSNYSRDLIQRIKHELGGNYKVLVRGSVKPQCGPDFVIQVVIDHQEQLALLAAGQVIKAVMNAFLNAVKSCCEELFDEAYKPSVQVAKVTIRAEHFDVIFTSDFNFGEEISEAETDALLNDIESFALSQFILNNHVESISLPCEKIFNEVRLGQGSFDLWVVRYGNACEHWPYAVYDNANKAFLDVNIAFESNRGQA